MTTTTGVADITTRSAFAPGSSVLRLEWKFGPSIYFLDSEDGWKEMVQLADNIDELSGTNNAYSNADVELYRCYTGACNFSDTAKRQYYGQLEPIKRSRTKQYREPRLKLSSTLSGDDHIMEVRIYDEAAEIHRYTPWNFEAVKDRLIEYLQNVYDGVDRRNGTNLGGIAMKAEILSRKIGDRDSRHIRVLWPPNGQSVAAAISRTRSTYHTKRSPPCNETEQKEADGNEAMEKVEAAEEEAPPPTSPPGNDGPDSESDNDSTISSMASGLEENEMRDILEECLNDAELYGRYRFQKACLQIEKYEENPRCKQILDELREQYLPTWVDYDNRITESRRKLRTADKSDTMVDTSSSLSSKKRPLESTDSTQQQQQPKQERPSKKQKVIYHARRQMAERAKAAKEGAEEEEEGDDKRSQSSVEY